MRITLLGGGESIGASCAVAAIDGRRWVIDCGIRLRGTEAGQLPDLLRLEAGPAPTAVLITHAHLDHVGALPILYARYPLVQVYATPPTVALTGYQDEESPGWRLLDCAAGRSESLPIDGVEVRPGAKVTSYALSGHAWGMQIASLLGSLKPRDVILVHGDTGARHDLADLLIRARLIREVESRTGYRLELN
jgi:Cft2 family RNA processing exonuclease